MLRWQVFLTAIVAVAAAGSIEKKVVCYFSSWAVYRYGAGQFDVPHINPSLCTHLIYTFAGISDDGDVKSLDEFRDLPDNFGKDGFRKFNQLRNLSREVKTLVAIGGWNEDSTKYSVVVGDPILRAKLVKNAVAFVQKYGFDGLDIDWEYPGQRGGIPEDVQNYVLLLKELRQEFDKKGLLLSAAVAPAESSASISYNISEVAKHLDFINLMTYDFHGSWDPTTGFNSPLYPSANETVDQKMLNIDAGVKYWLSQGAPAAKLNIAIPSYGRTFTLANVNETSVGAPRSGPGNSGPYTRTAGMLGYHEICRNLKAGGWTVVRDKEQRVPYTFKGNQWIGYDDVTSAIEKSEYVKTHGLGGALIWTIDTDDFRGECGDVYPVLKAVNKILRNGNSTNVENTSDGSSGNVREDDICVKPGYVRDPSNCSRYYLCQKVNGELIPREYNCPPGLHFNLDKEICDWPRNAKCKSKQ